MKLTEIAIRNIKRNKKRSILSIISTAIATFAIVFLFSYLDGLETDMRNITFNYDTGEIIIRNKNYDEKIYSLDRAVDNYMDILSLIRDRYTGIQYSPRLRFPSTVLLGDKSYVCFGVAVDFESEIKYLNMDNIILDGNIPRSSREAVIGVGLANELGLKVGDKFTPITMTRRGASSGITFTISGLGKFRNSVFTNKTFLVPLTELPSMLKMTGAVSEILIKNIGDKKLDTTVGEINQLLGNNGFKSIQAESWKDVGLGFSMIRMANITYAIVAFFFFFLASSVIANTMLMVVFERRKEIGTITAMGMNGYEVIRLFFLEALYLGLLGAGFGVLAGVILILPLSYTGIDLSSVAEDFDMGMSFVIYPELNIKSTLLVYIYSVFVSSFVSLFPSRSAAKVDPVVALRDE